MQSVDFWHPALFPDSRKVRRFRKSMLHGLGSRSCSSSGPEGDGGDCAMTDPHAAGAPGSAAPVLSLAPESGFYPAAGAAAGAAGGAAGAGAGGGTGAAGGAGAESCGAFLPGARVPFTFDLNLSLGSSASPSMTMAPSIHGQPHAHALGLGAKPQAPAAALTSQAQAQAQAQQGRAQAHAHALAQAQAQEQAKVQAQAQAPKRPFGAHRAELRGSLPPLQIGGAKDDFLAGSAQFGSAWPPAAAPAPAPG
eukprot:jgi/Mesen1/10791/ME000092S10279